MHESAAALTAWESFYVIVGSSGGALIGLQFVVMTLVGDSRLRTQTGGLAAFSTPTIVHLTGALGRPALVMVPFGADWRYGASGERMIWYPSVRLLRQQRLGDWSAVFEEVSRRLRAES